MSEGRPHSVRDWQEIRNHAQTRVSMYIGSQENGHKLAISSVLRLVWQAKVFRHPQSVVIDLAPEQYIVRAECGPLIRPVQQIFSFGNGQVMSETWHEESKAYFERINSEDKEKGINWLHQRQRYNWRYCFSGPTGPRLAEPSYTFILARCGIWGLRTNDGLWCESYQEGIPVGKPFLLNSPSPIGLLAAADLDARWFTGLPFTEADVDYLTNLSDNRYPNHSKYAPRPYWTAGKITVKWHSDNTLVSDKLLTARGLQDLL